MSINGPSDVSPRPIAEGKEKIKRKILIVEDDPAFRDFIKMEMEAWGYEVFTATDGPTAFRMLGQHNPDLVTMDGDLPAKDENGIAVGRENGKVIAGEMRAKNRAVIITMLSSDSGLKFEGRGMSKMDILTGTNPLRTHLETLFTQEQRS